MLAAARINRKPCKIPPYAFLGTVATREGERAAGLTCEDC